MKLLCFSSFLFFSFIPLFGESVAFYYGNNFERKNIERFDIVVVQPDLIPENLLKEDRDKFFAYISVSESDSKLPKELSLGENKDWNSFIGDLRKKEYRDILIKKIEEAQKKGFINFFFDTIDSYQMVLKTKKEQQEYEQALINFIKEIKQKNPNSRLIMNRGFEIADSLTKEVEFIAAESLYKGIDTKEKKYIDMKAEDTKWLKEKLNQLKSKGYKIIVIDYLPENKEGEAIDLARKIKEDGFIPYVSNYDLTNWGFSEYEYVKRDVLLIYDSKKAPDVVYSQAHRIVSMPLEYMGYRPVIKDISNLPENTDKFAGIIVVLENNEVDNPKYFFNWILDNINKGKKILFLGYIPFPFSEKYFSPLDIKIEKNKSNPGEKIELIKDSKFDFEAPPDYFYSKELLIPKDSNGIHIFKNSKNQLHYQAAITKWGGYAIESSWIYSKNNIEILPINPFLFFKKALRLKEIPALDPTTENSRRLLIAHIDGDGFSSLYEKDPNFYASEILKKEILSVYKIPHSISIIRGEIESPLVKPETTSRLKKIAREIFSLTNVEIGNHSYSHPFKWIDIKNASEYQTIEQVYGLNIPGYNFSIEEEILGTKNWIEKELTDGSKKNNIFFWTGDCIAPTAALRLLKNNNMLNINGGYTTITKLKPYLSNISPFGLNRDGYYQIYTGQQNENVYTNLWSGPFWGYKNVIQTFQMTDKPRRLKPIDIYYHFYSASKTSSLKALKEVYEYALNQKINPSFTSDYIEKVMDFYESEIYSYKDEFLIISNGDIKTLRTNSQYYPEISQKYSVSGYSDYNNERYLNLYGKTPYKIKLTDKIPSNVYLKDSNAKIENFNIGSDNLEFTLKGYIPIEYNLGNKENCNLKEENSKKEDIYIKKVYVKCK